MTDTQLVLWTFGKVILNFLPAVLVAIVGLAILAVDERRCKNELEKNI